MESWHHWDDFLKIMSRDNKLTDAENESFLLQFARQNLGKPLEEIAAQLPQMENRLNTHKKRMSEVYDKFSQSCVELKSKTHKSKPLQKWLETRYSQWLPVQDSDAVLSSATTERAIDWRDICHKVVENQHLRRQATAQQYELNIYVPLGLMERPKTPNLRSNPAEDDLRQKEPELQIVQTYKDDAFFQKVIAENRTEKGKHIAIIGEPGAGKTTLLGELAERLPKNSPDFPICIRLADLRESTIEDYLLDNWLKKALEYIDADAENVTPEIRKALKQLFCQGKVWLLLDAVDEMAAESPVQALAKIREQLTDWVGKARVVLTCRLNVWDATISNTLTNFETYKTLEFEPDDVDKFIRQWFEQASQDEKQRNSGNESFWQEQGKRLQQQLKEPGKERIRELVRNPLRLSMLCQSWCVAERDLPSTKAALYEQFTTYFFEWKQEEFQQKHRVLKETDKKQIQQALAKLALAAMESANRFRIEEEFAIGQMEEQWFDLADELGWLVLVDRDTRTKKPVYSFLHSSFQEYFAALAVDDWDYFLPRNHIDKPVLGKRYRIFEPQWKEVILLWLGREKIEAQKREFIDALVNFKDGCGQWDWENIGKGFYQYRAYFLAASGINEFKSHPLANKIVNQLVNLGFGYFSHKKMEWQSYMGVILGYVMINKILTKTDKLSTIQEICSILENPQYPESFYRRAISVLGEIGQGNTQAIAVLKRVLNNTKNPEIHHQVLIGLNKIESGQLSTIDGLIKTTTIPIYHKKTSNSEDFDKVPHLIELSLNEKSDKNTRMNALAELKRASQEDSRIINALVEVIEKDNDPSLRRFALYCLGQIDRGGITVTRVSMKILENFKKEDEKLRFKAVKSLRKSNPNNAGNNVDCLLSILNENKNPDLHIALLEALGKIGYDNPKAIDTLIDILTNSKDEDIRFQSADSLGRIDPGNSKAVAVIIEILENTKYEYTSPISNFPDIHKQFEDFLESSKALDSLGEIGKGSKNAIHALVKVLEIAKAEYARRRGTKSLLKILTTDEHRQEVVSLLLPHVKTETYENNFDLFKDCYEVLWDCAQNLPYPTFYEAWHDSPTTPDPEVPENTADSTPSAQSFNSANLPQLLAAAINNQPDLCTKVKLICIDTHQFIDPENPAPEIYDQMQNQNCPEWQNGYPDTMQKLKLYWNSLRRQSEISLFFICYDSTALSPTPTGFSVSFLKALSKFDRAICIVCETEDIPLQTFSPSQPDLVEEIVKWIKAD